MFYQKDYHSMDFDQIYITYTCAYAFGVDLNKELKRLEESEQYELCHVLKTVIEDMKQIEK